MQLLLADQLGPHFDLGGPKLLPEVLNQFSKRKYHRQKAHLILYAIRARSLDTDVERVSLSSYRELVKDPRITKVIHPTSREQLALVSSLGLDVAPARGFASGFEDWKSKPGRSHRLEDFYRYQRQRLGILMDDSEPCGGSWNFDTENRLPAPKGGLGLQHFEVIENELDAEVRRELDEIEASGQASFIGKDGPRKFAGTRAEALQALQHFIEYQLPAFGPYEDAVHDSEWVLAHSMLSAPMNLGLLDPLEVARAAEAAYRSNEAPIQSVEGFIRQVIGWRDYVWHLYWEFGPEYLSSNYLSASADIPPAWRELNSKAVEARCVSETLSSVERNAWAHHIQRLMILGNFALQAGYLPSELNDWFIDAFVDGTPWVMPANVIGMTLFADGGRMSTKPYVSGGAYISKMTNYCGGCKFDPKKRVGEDACPFTAGYWNFLDKHRDLLSSNHRMWQSYAGLKKIADIDQIRSEQPRRIDFLTGENPKV